MHATGRWASIFFPFSWICVPFLCFLVLSIHLFQILCLFCLSACVFRYYNTCRHSLSLCAHYSVSLDWSYLCASYLRLLLRWCGDWWWRESRVEFRMRESALRFEDLFLRKSLSRSKSRGEKQKRASSCLCFRTLHYGALCFGKSCHYLFAKKAETLTCIDLRSQKKTALTRVSFIDVTASKGDTYTSAQLLLPVGPTQETATLFLFVFILFRRRFVRLVCLCSVCSSKKSTDRARQLGVHPTIFSPSLYPTPAKTSRFDPRRVSPFPHIWSP